MAEKRRWRLRAGTYADLAGRVWTKGEVIETELDLGTMYLNKFDEVPGAKPTKGRPLNEVSLPAPVEEKTPEAKPAPAEEPKENEAPDFGQDVTADFSVAVESSLLVFKKGKHYAVTTKEDPTKALAEGLTSKGKVESFVDEYLEDK